MSAPRHTALLDGTRPLHSVHRVNPDDLPGPYPQIDRDTAREHGLYLGIEEGETPEPYRYGALVTGDRLTFTQETP